MIKAKLVHKDGTKEDTMLSAVPTKEHQFVTNDGSRWSVDEIYWVQESIQPSGK